MSYYRQIIEALPETITVPSALRNRRVEVYYRWMNSPSTASPPRLMPMAGPWAFLKKPLVQCLISRNAQPRVSMKYARKMHDLSA